MRRRDDYAVFFVAFGLALSSLACVGLYAVLEAWLA